MDDDYFDEETMLNWLHNTQTSPGGIGDISNDFGIDNSNLQSVEGPSFSRKRAKRSFKKSVAIKDCH